MGFPIGMYEMFLKGYQVVTYGRYGARVRDAAGNPVFNIRIAKFERLKYEILRQTKSGIYVIDLRKVRSFHGNHVCKKLYKKLYKEMRNAKNIQPTAGKGI